MEFSTTLLLAIMVMITLVISIGLTFVYIRDKTLEEIRADVYQLFLKAESLYKESKSGQQKMEYVISLARSMLPGWVKPFITESVLRKIIQVWFETIKDLLDDGKYNKS